MAGCLRIWNCFSLGDSQCQSETFILVIINKTYKTYLGEIYPPTDVYPALSLIYNVTDVQLSIDSIWLESESPSLAIESSLMLLIETCCDYFHVFTDDLEVCVQRQCCIIKDWHPTVVMPFCEPQLVCTLRTSFTLIAGEMRGKRKLCIYHLPPIRRMSHLFKCLLSFFIFLPAEPFQLTGKRLVLEIWRSWILLHCQFS